MNMKPLKQPIVTTYHEKPIEEKHILDLIKERQAEIVREKIADNIKPHE